jgi:CubicO group peptidase (beta-lactamase class C family)
MWVISSLAKPWLPLPEAGTPSQYGDRITLRHLLTHSSGLSNQVNPVVKTITFAPGEAFSYSGVGFMYLQEVIEQVTGRSLEEVTRELVFAPLAMASSNYVNNRDLRSTLANGHCKLGPFLARPAQVFAVLLVAVGFFIAGIQRVRIGRWILSWKMATISYVLAALLGALAGDLLMGPGGRKWTLLAILWLASYGIALAVVAFAVQQVFHRVSPLRDGRKRRRGQTLLCIAVGAIGLLWVSCLLSVPVPKGPSVPPNAAYSLRASAGDLANFLIEFGDPQYLDGKLMAEMRSPQVQVNEDNSWGLGLGIQHSAGGNSLWHGGDNRDFHSQMVIYPDQEFGMVILTNGEQGRTLAQDVVQRALGGKAAWRSGK